jgi:hypothetical protein
MTELASVRTDITALEGMIGRFPIELRDAIYRAL